MTIQIAVTLSFVLIPIKGEYWFVKDSDRLPLHNILLLFKQADVTNL
jgi:hypothetical protein